MFASLNPGHIGVKASLREGLALAERHGFGGYDASLPQLHEEVAEHGPAAVRELFQRHGLRVGAWNLPFMPYRVSEAELRQGLEKLAPMVRSAAAVGAVRAAMWIMPGDDERPFDENFAFHVERFRPVARLLADHGVRLGLEFVGPEATLRKFRHPFVRSLAGTIELAQAIGPNCGLLLDAWHWHCVGGTREELGVLTRDLLVHVHVDDAPAGVPRNELIDNRRKLPCTTGVIDIDGFMGALADAGYDGPVTAEPFDAEVNAMEAEQAVALTAKTTRQAVARGVRSGERGV